MTYIYGISQFKDGHKKFRFTMDPTELGEAVLAEEMAVHRYDIEAAIGELALGQSDAERGCVQYVLQQAYHRVPKRVFIAWMNEDRHRQASFIQGLLEGFSALAAELILFATATDKEE